MTHSPTRPIRSFVALRVRPAAACIIAAAGLMLPASPARAVPDRTPRGPVDTGPILDGNPVDLSAASIGLPADLATDHAVPDQDDLFEAIDRCVTDDMADRSAPGASIAVALDGEIVHARGFGTKHAVDGGDIDAETLFRIGSVTKMMTGAAVMQQVEAGTIDVGVPVTDYVPEFDVAAPWSADDITVHHLMTHSTGFPDRIGDAFDGRSLDEWAAGQSSVPLLAPPGSFFNYSNPGWSLAGLVLERASDMPYRDYISGRVWAPAGMPRTTFDPATVMADGNYSHGHAGGGIVAPDTYDSLWGGPAGFAFSTPSELVRFALLLSEGGGEVLSEASVESMTGARISTHASQGEAYGYGVFSEPLHDMTLYSHGGNIDGYSAQLAWVPERGFAVAILANISQSLSSAAGCTILAALDIDPPEPPERTTPPETWSDYAGTYGFRDQDLVERTAWVSHGGETLSLKVGSGPETPLVQVGGDTFQADSDSDGEGDGLVLTFIEDPERPGRSQWARNRGQVGIRAGIFQKTISLQGPGCRAIGFTPQIDLSEAALVLFGLDNPGIAKDELAVTADDPDDPTSAGIKRGFVLDSPTGAIEARLVGEPDDDLDLFLLHDADADGRFTPDELVASGTSPTSLESFSLSPPAGIPAGAYQVWVHGYAVRGDASRASLAVTAIGGDALSAEELTAPPVQDELTAIGVCADGDAVEGIDEERAGLMIVHTGRAPSTLFFPVRWRPSDEPAPMPDERRIFLPYALLRADARGGP